MVEFKELRVTPDSKNIIIDVVVNDLEGVYLDSIVIDTQDTYIENGPSTTPVYTYTVPDDGLPEVYTKCGCDVYDREGNSIYTDTEPSGTKHLHIILSATELGVTIQKNLFFVYVIASGTDEEDSGNYSIMGVVADLYPYYRKMMSYVKEVGNDCEIPKWFIDSYLRFKALELSLSTGHYTQAISYWRRFFTREIKCNCDEGT